MAIHAKKSGLMVGVKVLNETSEYWHIQTVDEKRPKFVMKNGRQGRVFGNEVSINDIEAWIHEQRKPKVSVLTNAQIYTLRRMSSGTEYRVQGNLKRAFERRPLPSSLLGFDDVNAPSIAPLIRKGLVMINPQYLNPNASSYYPVCLTAEGRAMVKKAVIHD